MNRKIRMISAIVVMAMTLGMSVVASESTSSEKESINNVSDFINQQQYQRCITENGIELISYESEDVNKTLFSGVYQSDVAFSQYEEVDINDISCMFWSGIENAVDDIVVVENISSNNNTDEDDVKVYVRTIFAFPAFSEENNELHLNFHLPAGATIEKINGIAEVNGQDYKLYVYNYSEPLAPGETSDPSLLEYVFDKDVTSEMIVQFGDEYRVLITSQAVQVNGFSAIANAFGATFGEVTVENHPWK